MKLMVKLAPNQRDIIVQLDKLDDQLGSLLKYVENLENNSWAQGKEKKADQLNELGLQIQKCRSEVEGDALKIIDDSPELKKALVQITNANKKIAAAIKQSADLDATLKNIASILDLIAKGLAIFV